MKARLKKEIRGHHSGTIGVRELRRQVYADRKKEPATLSLQGPRPTTRGECRAGPRPCPWIACRYHLYLEVSTHTGSLRLNVPGREVWELDESCALDVAERGPTTLDQIGKLLNLTRERVRQLELLAVLRLRRVVRRWR